MSSHGKCFEIQSIDKELYYIEKVFIEKYTKTVHQKPVPDRYLVRLIARSKVNAFEKLFCK